MKPSSKRKRDREPVEGGISNPPGNVFKRQRLDGNFRGAYVEVPRLSDHPKPPTLASISSKKRFAAASSSKDVTIRAMTEDLAEMNIDDQEVIDEANLVLPKEIYEEEDSGDLPIRYLDHFSIFDDETNLLISLDGAEDPKFGKNPYFVGHVSAKWISEEDEDFDEHMAGEGKDKKFNGQEEADEGDRTLINLMEVKVRSSAIVEIWESMEPERDGLVSEQSEIWLQTKCAWYILNRPSKEYKDLFLPRWIRHKLILLMGYLGPKTTSIDRFRRRFLKNEARWAEYEFGRRLDLGDLKTHMSGTLRYALSREDELPMVYTSLFGELCSEYDRKISLNRLSPHSSSEYATTSVSHSEHQHRPPVHGQPDPRLTKTFCTPFIQSIVQQYFPSLQDSEQDSDDEDIIDHKEDDGSELIHIAPPRRAPRIEYKVKANTGSQENLAWVKVNTQLYTPGDTVFIRPEQEGEVSKRDIHPIDLPEQIWFGRIIRLYREPVNHEEEHHQDPVAYFEVYAHILWFLPATKTSIKELAHPQELVVIDECDNNIPVESFIGVCRNRLLGINQQEPVAGDDPLDFFYRYLWDRDDDDAFLDINVFLHHRLLYVPIDTPCPSCDRYNDYEMSKAPQISDNGVTINGIQYHPYDFAYILPEEQGKEYRIGQILSIDSKKVKVHLLARSMRSSEFYDDRLLEDNIRSNPKQFPSDHLEGKCSVQRTKSQNKLLEENDEFFCPDIKRWQPCTLCNQLNQPLSTGSPLMGLDIFSGAGGLSLGLESTGFVKTRWAVEFDKSAALTFSESHPDCTMYNLCINSLLRNAYETPAGDASRPLCSLEDGGELPPFPKAGEVDIIYGGPPCQGFSNLNHCPKADDPRNHLVLTFLSAVDMLQPRYVVMENVKGILFFRLGGEQAGIHRIEGGISRGIVKLIKRLLTALNYQVRYGILYAGHYGSPQLRRRVIFIASKRGIHLPDLPQPSHVASNIRLLNVLVGEDHAFTVSRRRMDSAPLGAVTVKDMIGDLPAWEWKNPHAVYAATPSQRSEEKARAKMIPAVEGTSKPFETGLSASGPRHPMHYVNQPQTRYQQQLRLYSTAISQHWCPGFGPKEIERICSIPMSSSRFVDHTDLPRLLRIGLYGDKRYNGRYGRLNENGVFNIALGTLVPNSPAGTILHPTLHRIITIREMARSQGFPDHIEFLLEPNSRSVKSITKQIGNAVPIPMAAAIGKEILKASQRTHQKEREERESSIAL